MPGEAFLAVAWAAGVLEGFSVLSLAEGKIDAEQTSETTSARIIVPAVLYGTLSLPLSLIGAAPGPTLIGRLPFAPKIEALDNSLLPPLVSTSPPPPAVEVQKLTVVHRGKRRPDLLREENRSRYLASSSSAAPKSPSPSTYPIAKTAATRYISTLDGHALLPTPLAEALRRSRFLFAGAALVTMVLSYQTNQEEENRRKSEEALLRQRNGKDVDAIRNLVETSKQGAVVRWSSTLQEVLNTKKSAIATIPLCTNSNAMESNAVYWNPGQRLEDLKTIPISSGWLLRTKTSPLLVLEADITPWSTNEYFLNIPQNDKFSMASLVLDSLIATARKNGVLPSKGRAVKVVLSSCRPALPLSSQDIYMDTHSGLGVQVSSVLERMHRELEAELVEQSALHPLNDTTSTEIARASQQLPQQLPSATPASQVRGERAAREYLLRAANASIVLVDMIGSSIRQAATWCVTYLSDVHGDTFRSHRVVHVLSDQRPFVRFLQQSLRDWRIVWYDANKRSDVELYKNSGAAISVVCCGSDLTTSALLAATTRLVSKKRRVLAIFEQTTPFVPSGVSTMFIQDVHNSLFSQIHTLLAEGKTPEEVQEIINLIR